jgi:hypothetical protein
MDSWENMDKFTGHVMVKGVNGQQFMMQANFREPTMALRALVADRMGCDSKSIKLYHDKVKLHTHKSLAAQQVKVGSNISAVQMLTGGGKRGRGAGGDEDIKSDKVRELTRSMVMNINAMANDPMCDAFTGSATKMLKEFGERLQMNPKLLGERVANMTTEELQGLQKYVGTKNKQQLVNSLKMAVMGKLVTAIRDRDSLNKQLGETINMAVELAYMTQFMDDNGKCRQDAPPQNPTSPSTPWAPAQAPLGHQPKHPLGTSPSTPWAPAQAPLGQGLV